MHLFDSQISVLSSASCGLKRLNRSFDEPSNEGLSLT